VPTCALFLVPCWYPSYQKVGTIFVQKLYQLATGVVYLMWFQFEKNWAKTISFDDVMCIRVKKNIFVPALMSKTSFLDRFCSCSE
jgi:hypothetical protein